MNSNNETDEKIKHNVIKEEILRDFQVFGNSKVQRKYVFSWKSIDYEYHNCYLEAYIITNYIINIIDFLSIIAKYQNQNRLLTFIS